MKPKGAKHVENRARKGTVHGSSDRADTRAKEVRSYSSSVIELLKRLKFKQVAVADMLGKHPSFVSHVKRNQRCLTVADLEKIEEETGLPLFWLLLETTDEAVVPEELRGIFQAAKKLFDHTTMAKIVAKTASK